MDGDNEQAVAEGALPITARKRESSITFEWLHDRVQQYVRIETATGPSWLERWSFWMAFAMTGLGLLSGLLARWLPADLVSRIVVVCLVLELAGLLLSFSLMARRSWPKVMRLRKSHANEIDADFRKWEELIAELRKFPRAEREARLRFVTSLRNRMGERMGYAFGGLQRLGIFPVLIALYLQFRNWEWGDWKTAFNVNLVAGLLIWAMVLFYAVGWALIELRTRIELYVELLENSLKD